MEGKLVIVAPTRHLKNQWAINAEEFGLHLDAAWNPQDRLPDDMHGIVTTYQQVATAAPQLRRVASRGLVILDEVHHAGDDLAWGDGISEAFGEADRRLSLSGTPFRSDDAKIPFLQYTGGQVVPDIEYGYGEALKDGRVVRPVFFPSFGGHMEWTAPDGALLSATFDDPLPRSLANQRLRAALSLDGEWLPAVLGHAHKQLLELRVRRPEAAGLVIARDQNHAQAIARLLRERFQVRATVAVSEDTEASDKISKFAASNDPWIVAVRMISEGVDIPRLRVGVFATTTTTELFFRQAVGRIVRFTGGRGRAYMFVPDDARLRHWGNTITEARRHLLNPHGRDDEFPQGERAERGDDEQMSLFSVLSATASDPAPDLTDIFADPDAYLEGEDEHGAEPLGADPKLTIDLTILPPVSGPSFIPTVPGGRKERERQRSINARWVRELVVSTGLGHAQVNAELNRLSGVAKVSEATVQQLEKRARMAAKWQDQENKRDHRTTIES